MPYLLMVPAIINNVDLKKACTMDGLKPHREARIYNYVE